MKRFAVITAEISGLSPTGNGMKVPPGRYEIWVPDGSRASYPYLMNPDVPGDVLTQIHAEQPDVEIVEEED